MAISKSLLYSRLETITTATNFETINQLNFNFFTDLANNPPAGCVLDSQTIPAVVNNTFKYYQVTFVVNNKYKLRLRTNTTNDTTSTSNKDKLYSELYSLTDVPIIPAFVTASGTGFTYLSNPSTTTTLQISIHRITNLGIFDVHTFGENTQYSTRASGFITLTNTDGTGYDEIYFSIGGSTSNMAHVRFHDGTQATYEGLSGTSSGITIDGDKIFAPVFVRNASGQVKGFLSGGLSPYPYQDTVTNEGSKVFINGKYYICLTRVQVFLPYF